jgi:DNA-binding transcriptional MocR family regulator
MMRGMSRPAPARLDAPSGGPLHEAVAERVRDLIRRRTFRPGDRLPSVRALGRQLGVGVNTVVQAYAALEAERVLEARPRAGHFVASPLLEPAGWTGGAARACAVPAGRAPLDVMRRLSDPALVNLGRVAPDPALLPVEALRRALAAEARRHPAAAVSYADSRGLRRLRTLVARRALDGGSHLAPDDLVITAGCTEAIALALQATCRSGDAVAIGSPIFGSFLDLIQSLGLRVVEIPTSPRDGPSLPALAAGLERGAVRAVIATPSFDNPTGSRMPDAAKRELVALLARHEVPLIEDDVYGELAFEGPRPGTAHGLDRRGRVLLCSSFSKTLAPGYRVGWIAAGRYAPQVERLQAIRHIAGAAPTQLAIAEFLSGGGYDRHLRSVRRRYAEQVARMRAAIGDAFPPGTRVTQPQGGYVLWVELPPPVDAFHLFERALELGVGIAPGPLFTLGPRFGSCLRLCAATWSERVARAVATVGRLACQQDAVDRPRAPVPRGAVR